MLKIIIKRNILSEGKAPSYSKTAYGQIIEKFTNNLSNPQDRLEQFIPTPLREIIESNKKSIINGLPFLYYVNILGLQSNHKDILTNWDTKNKKFNDAFIQNILNENIPLTVRAYNKVNPKDKYSRAVCGAYDADNRTKFFIFFYQSVNSISKLQESAKHELRHLVQRVNDACIEYAKQISETNDPSKINFQNLNYNLDDPRKKYGLGKQKTGVKDVLPGKDIEKYLTSDTEYETSLMGIIEAYFARISKDKKIKNQVATNGANKTAIKYIKQFLQKDINEPSLSGSKKILSAILKARPKEAPKDMVRYLEDLLASL